ncbi:unnamed protein product [Cylicostephanus goldi]|uniref:Lipid-binding serum glycoprotein N-terminal domain-containing protein n=1 Tax=Cylicostephanus goldi TaxID=71465 RepID=A0A3P6RLP7_CYLGO|nr:unnamed protein product [Cylicostephanus goldi]
MRLQLLLLALGVCVFAQRPNSQIRIYDSAFKFLTKATCQILNAEVDKLGANFITLNTTMGSGELILKTALSVNKFVCPVGDAVLSATNLDIDLAAKIVMTADKHPQLQMGECKANLGVFDYKFNGEYSDLPNMFNDVTGILVKNIIKDLACKITQNTILTRYNELIAGIPLHYELPYDFSLDWALYEPKYTK